jgi:cell shape-determining protein MreC
MNFLLKNKPKRNYNSKVIFGSVLFLLLLLISLAFPNFLRSTSQNGMRPLWFLRDKVFNLTYFVTDFFSFKTNLLKENDRLSAEVATLRLNKIDYDILLKENEDLKLQIGASLRGTKIIAGVLSKPPQSPYDTFIIDANENSGVSVGDKVYASDSIILGYITTVSSKTSTVKLFSSGDQKQEAISSRTGASFVLEGSGGSNFQVEVPKEADILWGDIFLYPGINSSVLATVYFVDSSSQSSFKRVYLRIPTNALETKHVFILK